MIRNYRIMTNRINKQRNTFFRRNIIKLEHKVKYNINNNKYKKHLYGNLNKKAIILEM